MFSKASLQQIPFGNIEAMCYDVLTVESSGTPLSDNAPGSDLMYPASNRMHYQCTVKAKRQATYR